ncbi:death-associated protein kinase 2-like protein [Pitangus sulphuratus]|nr:death-associated protein kinase 2-like protein [Pitangus sulphuratus]
MDKQQALVRKSSVVNMENFKRQYARRRWKLSYRIVSLCNRLSRSLVSRVLLQEELNDKTVLVSKEPTRLTLSPPPLQDQGQ